jgi:hypothetical protein
MPRCRATRAGWSGRSARSTARGSRSPVGGTRRPRRPRPGLLRGAPGRPDRHRLAQGAGAAGVPSRRPGRQSVGCDARPPPPAAVRLGAAGPGPPLRLGARLQAPARPGGPRPRLRNGRPRPAATLPRRGELLRLVAAAAPALRSLDTVGEGGGSDGNLDHPQSGSRASCAERAAASASRWRFALPLAPGGGTALTRFSRSSHRRLPA